jgi:hypothetical protein
VEEAVTHVNKIALQTAISAICLGLLAAHVTVPGFKLDPIAIGLLVVAVLPWASDLIKSLELPSGFKLEFQELRGEVEHQKRELDRLTEFLFTHFVTEAEFRHLQALHNRQRYPFQRASYFDNELRRLRGLGLLTGAVGYLPQEGDDLNDHLKITERGSQYVVTREAISKATAPLI